jgi:hypothetical protein
MPCVGAGLLARPRRRQPLQQGRELELHRYDVARRLEFRLELVEAMSQVGNLHVAVVGGLAPTPAMQPVEDPRFVLRAPTSIVTAVARLTAW